MFPSHAVVPVFVFTVLLNFFYLYSPIVSEDVPYPQNFTSCEECQNSSCYIQTNGTCALGPDNTTFTCFKCASDPSGNLLFDTQENCNLGCNDTAKKCVCNGTCYSCLPTAGLDMSALQCTVPTQAVDEHCNVVPYGLSSTNTSSGTV